MDRPQPVSAELKRDLHNLRQLNRFFGSYALINHFLRRWIKSGNHLRIADLATGSGDIPRLAADHARSIGATVAIDAIDQNPATLEIAKELSPRYPEISFIRCQRPGLATGRAVRPRALLARAASFQRGGRRSGFETLSAIIAQVCAGFRSAARMARDNRGLFPNRRDFSRPMRRKPTEVVRGARLFLC